MLQSPFPMRLKSTPPMHGEHCVCRPCGNISMIEKRNIITNFEHFQRACECHDTSCTITYRITCLLFDGWTPFFVKNYPLNKLFMFLNFLQKNGRAPRRRFHISGCKSTRRNNGLASDDREECSYIEWIPDCQNTFVCKPCYSFLTASPNVR